MQKIWYEPHPVSPERKAELRAQGYSIVDVEFAPADWIEKSAELADESGGDDFPDDEAMRTAIEKATGKAPHHRTGRDKLIEQYKAIGDA